MEAKKCRRCRKGPARPNRTSCADCARKQQARRATRYRELNPNTGPRGTQIDRARIAREEAAALQWLVERGHRTA